LLPEVDSAIAACPNSPAETLNFWVRILVILPVGLPFFYILSSCFSILSLIPNIIEEIKTYFVLFSSFFAHWYYQLLISKKRSSLPSSLSTFIPISSYNPFLARCYRATVFFHRRRDDKKDSTLWAFAPPEQGIEVGAGNY
jgi:hypothetical protein